MTISIDLDAFDLGIADVRTAVRLLDTDERAIDQRMRGFLGSGWTGAAADSFIAAWDDWRAAAGQVQEALDGMGDLLGATRRDLVEQDGSSRRSLDSVAARLTDRLG